MRNHRTSARRWKAPRAAAVLCASLLALPGTLWAQSQTAPPQPAAPQSAPAQSDESEPVPAEPSQAVKDLIMRELMDASLEAQRPEAVRGLELKDTRGVKLPLSLDFMDSSGKLIKLKDALKPGRPTILTMVYFRCPLMCPQLQRTLVTSLARQDFTAGRDFNLVVVSFNPFEGAKEATAARDTALLLYGRAIDEETRKGFRYLTGSVASTKELAQTLGFPYRYLQETGEFSHGTAVYVVTPEGVVSNCFPKLDLDPGNMKLALVDASDGKLGSTFDRFTFWCYHWDPTSATYKISPMAVMRLGAIATLVVVVAIGTKMWIGEWRRRRRRAATVPNDDEVPGRPVLGTRPSTDLR